MGKMVLWTSNIRKIFCRHIIYSFFCISVSVLVLSFKRIFDLLEDQILRIKTCVMKEEIFGSSWLHIWLEKEQAKKIVLVYHIAERSLPFFNLLNEVKSLAVFNGEPLRDKTQKKFRFFRRKYFMTFFIFTEGSKPCTNISNILE